MTSQTFWERVRCPHPPTHPPTHPPCRPRLPPAPKHTACAADTPPSTAHPPSIQVLARSGLGEETYLPEGVMAQPPDINMRRAREEAHLVLFSCGARAALEKLFMFIFGFLFFFFLGGGATALPPP